MEQLEKLVKASDIATRKDEPKVTYGNATTTQIRPYEGLKLLGATRFEEGTSIKYWM